MSLRTTLLPHLVRPYSILKPSPTSFSRPFHYLSQPSTTTRPRLPPPIALTRPAPPRPAYGLYTTIGLGLSFLTYHTYSPSRKVHCEDTLLGDRSTPKPEVGGGSPPADSILSVYQLSFGGVCGLCTGVFVKKGLRAIAFLLGGVFVLLQVSGRLTSGRTSTLMSAFDQYLSSKSIVSVDWARLAGRYDSTFGTKTAQGHVQAPTVGGVWAWFVDFVTANFQRECGSFLDCRYQPSEVGASFCETR